MRVKEVEKPNSDVYVKCYIYVDMEFFYLIEWICSTRSEMYFGMSNILLHV
jgi:hypothetical protein